MMRFAFAIIIIFVLLLIWVLVQHIARRFATSHPELGDFREEGSGCGTSCGCKPNSCNIKDKG